MDDLLYFDETEKRIQEMEATLVKEFIIINLDESNYYLEMNMNYDRTKSIYHLY